MGNFIQIHKFLRWKAGVSKYNLEASFNYFRNNDGSHDYYGHRTVLV
ncbi:MAG: hypothetical protein LBV77_02810 [Candidatus Adiutrix intracellularis]|nr:hypothetical protein [Candidatus Adiutrix intracellularis]